MEGANEALAQANNEQTHQSATTIISTITTLSQVAPISQSEKEDFEPDPKWEITTLEKASFDDIYLDTGIDNQPQAANGNFAQPATAQQQMAQIAESKQDQKETNLSANNEHVSLVTTLAGSEKSIQISQNPRAEVNTIALDNTECFISLHSIMKGTSSETSNDESHGVTAQQLSNTNVKIIEPIFHSVESTSSITKSFNQDEAIKPTVQDVSTHQSTEHVTDANQTSSALSQSSVDAQMETVIEHVVELGGGHQFSQTIGHHEDKEKAVESIQREILGCRNPMESLAEVASLQPVLNETVADHVESSEKVKSEETKEKKLLKEKKKKVPEEMKGEVSNETKEEVLEDKKGEIAQETKEEIPQKTKEVLEDTKEEISEETEGRVSDETKVKISKKSKVKDSVAKIEDKPIGTIHVGVDESKIDESVQEKKIDDKRKNKESENEMNESIREPSPEPERRNRSLRVRAPKRTNVELESPKAQPVKKQLKRQRAIDEHNKSYGAIKKTPTIKLPIRQRTTISVSDPSIRPDSRYEVYDHDGGSNRKYRCNNCKYSTDRLNNIVFHHKRSNEFVSGVRCPGVLRAAEEQRAEIIRIQQTPKGNKRKALR